MNIEINGITLPVDPRFVPVCTLDANGLPVPLSSGGGASPGSATEEKQDDQIGLATSHLNLTMGLTGSVFVNNITANSGSFVALVAVTDCVITSITLHSTSSGASALTGVTLVAGQTLIVQFTSITLASGVAQLVLRS